MKAIKVRTSSYRYRRGGTHPYIQVTFDEDMRVFDGVMGTVSDVVKRFHAYRSSTGRVSWQTGVGSVYRPREDKINPQNLVVTLDIEPGAVKLLSDYIASAMELGTKAVTIAKNVETFMDSEQRRIGSKLRVELWGVKLRYVLADEARYASGVDTLLNITPDGDITLVVDNRPADLLAELEKRANAYEKQRLEDAKTTPAEKEQREAERIEKDKEQARETRLAMERLSQEVEAFNGGKA